MTIETDIRAALARNGWFARQTPALQERLAAAGRIAALRRGQWVYSQGDEGTGLCAVISGALRLEVALGPDRDVLIGLATAPTVLGQTRRSGGGPRILTVRANTPAQVLMIADDALDRVAADQPMLWRAVNELVYAQLEQATRLAAQLLIQSPAGRVAMRLLQFADGSNVSVSQADLAEMTGLSRKTINGHLAALEQEGVIVRGYRAITLRDAAALARMAGGAGSDGGRLTDDAAAR